jgi:predicted nucleotidyltransferase
MRLTPDQIDAIHQAARRVLGHAPNISVFGSRARDDLRGGDIDLFIETDKVLENRAKTICQLAGAVTMALGERRIDVVLKDANTPPALIFDIARRTGVLI